ncbi:UNVERIFIED_CONTAM: hypothetical protein PYX00_003718 [Menopon gallinae]|uniref:Caspase-8 n=1 Tax=Menopon gallinae TaxID=328185 RepID=A0AAW2I1R0_9NEOP
MDLKKELDMRSKLMFISRNLKIFEKISVIFFVSDKPHLGSKVMEILLATDSKALQNKAFFTWAKKQTLFSSTDWCERFAEILFIIQNHRLVKYLGYEKEEMERKLRMNSMLYSHELKIVLFRLCEELNRSQTAQIIDSIKKENNSDELKISNYKYLERFILELCKRDIISIDMDKKINLDVIIKHLEPLNAENCPSMLGKPKIFIIQSCQGQNWQKLLQGVQDDDDEVEETETDAPASSVRGEVFLNGPQKGDSIIAWSTVQGYASFRDRYNGSWYIEELCKELWKFGQVTDLVDILTLVNNNLRSKVYDGQFMVPSLMSSLGGKIQFPFVKENWVRGRVMMFKRLYFETFFSEFLGKSDVALSDMMKLHTND